MGSRVPVPRRPRHLAAVVALAILAAYVLAPASARAGRYTVAQCDRANRAYPDATFERRFGGDYAFAFRCEEDEDGNSLQIHPVTAAPRDRWGRISWAAPPGAGIVGVSLEARMRNDAGHQASLSFLDANGNELGRIATGRDEATGFESFGRQLTDSGRPRFAAALECVRADGCKASDRARNWIRSVRLTIDDRSPAAASLAGSLVAPGWHRGAADLLAGAVDPGSGVRALDVRVNGRPVPPSQTFACATIAGTALVSRMQPCAPWRVASARLDTAAAPFADGANAVVACATDFGTGATPSCRRTTAFVDNAPPELAFAAAEDPEDPELIRASATDRHSGIAGGGISYRPLAGGAWRELPTQRAGGALSARVNSSAEPPGLYLFRVRASDVAGNSAESTARAGGPQMVLRFPLREETAVEAAIDGARRARAAYGHRPELQAILRDAAGNPVAGQPLDVVEVFAAGSSLRPVSRSARTDERGRIAVQLSRGPSRTIRVAYAGSRRYLPAPERAVELGVATDTRLLVRPARVRAGRRALFEGSVGTFGAAMGRGKLVELQVRGGGIRRYRTVRQAFRTDPGGSWRLRYRFDRFYRRPTRFRFRVEVTPEAGWPYLTPAVSRSRVLTVLPRRQRR
jgi:hypothetical protein